MIIEAGQDVFDAAIMGYGSVEGIIPLLTDNPGMSVNDSLLDGSEVVFSSRPVNLLAWTNILRNGITLNNSDPFNEATWINSSADSLVTDSGSPWLI
jgi:hypothetical protein